MPQLTSVYIQNISNPIEFFKNGGTAKIYETGPFTLSAQINRVDVNFNDNVMSYRQYLEFTFEPENSCSTCQSLDEEVIVYNLAYAALLTGTKHEGALMLGQTCTQAQIRSIPNGALPYCTATQQLNPTVNCRCCYTGPNPGGGAVPCNSITSPTSTASGRVSWLAGYDGGLNISSASTNFPLSSGVISPITRRSSVSEVMFGAPSPLIGFFQYNTATSAQKNDLSETTLDMKDACYELFCPSVEELVQQIKVVGRSQGYQILSQVSCRGIVSVEELISNSTYLNNSRAEELRYLEGVNCRRFTPAVVVAALIANNSYAHSCHDPTDSPPCCLSSVSSTTPIRGPGLGCMRMVDGLISAPRRIFNTEQAQEYILPTSFHTNCADSSDRLIQTMDRGQSLYKKWYTPSTFTYPNMPWADPTVLATGLAINTDQAYFNNFENTTTLKLGIDDYFMSINKPYAMKKNLFLKSKFNAQSEPPVEDQTRKVFILYLYSDRELQYVQKSMINSIDTFIYHDILYIDDNETDIENRMRYGEVPYQNMVNLVYTSAGKPGMVSQPNFYGVEESIWNQTNNKNRKSPPGNGVNLYRLYDSYASDGSANRLESPELMTAESVAENSDIFTVSFEYTANTGSALKTSMANMISGYTLNCNPDLDSSCGLLTAVKGLNPTMCYPTMAGVQPAQRPCSAANVFTPRLQGEKVIPVIWFQAQVSTPSSYTDPFKRTIRMMHDLSISIITFIVLFVVSVVALVFLIHQDRKTNSDSNKR